MEVHFSKKITKNIQNKKVLITGAGTGLGRYMAYYLHILGANLLLVGRTEHTLRETQALCKSSTSAPEGSAVEVHAADLSAWDEAHAAVKRAVQIFGTLDVVVANAGQSMYENIADCQPIVFEAMMKNNYYSAVNIISHALEHITQSSGIVCAITSIQSFIGVPYHAPYCAAKHAVTGYLETLELELPK